MANEKTEIYEALTRKIARLYLSAELSEDEPVEPVEPVEVLDALITEAREITGEAPREI